MTRRVIVNADDLGYTTGVNRGILDAHERGIVTSASLMVDGAAAEEAAGHAAATPRLSVGLHAVVDDVPAANCEPELTRQLARFEELLGRPPSHVDSHHHRHREPLLQPLFIAFSQQHDVPLRDRAVRHCGLFYGRWDGRSHPEQIGVESLLRILEQLDAGVTEIGCHPGYAEGLASSYTLERELELRTLTDERVRVRLAELDIELIGWSDV